MLKQKFIVEPWSKMGMASCTHVFIEIEDEIVDNTYVDDPEVDKSKSEKLSGSIMCYIENISFLGRATRASSSEPLHLNETKRLST